jgi:N-acylneuraminate cytidylyltransferase/CMP-N,N'-diacetyllegionaminic acid synthase
MNKDGLILGGICARGGSKGVPRKSLRKLGGLSLIARTIRCAQACSMFDYVAVSTDDQEIAEVAKKYGAEVPFIRPAHLAQDDSPKWPVFRHLVENMERITGQRIDVFVDLDLGVPLRLPSDITGCVEQLLASHADVVTTAYEAERNPYFNMVEVDGQGLCQIVKPLSEPITCRQKAPAVFSLSPAVFAIRRTALWQYEHWSQSKFQIYVVPRERAIDIDTETDFRFVEALMREREAQENDIPSAAAGLTAHR